MRASTFFTSLFIAGVLCSPVYETKNVYVYETIVITEPNLPTPAPEPVKNSPAEQPRVFTWSFGNHHRFRHSWFYHSPPVATPVKEEPEKPTSTPKPAPPPSSTPPPPPPPPPPSSTPKPPATSEPEPQAKSQPEPQAKQEPKPEPTLEPTSESKPDNTNDGSPLSGGVSLLTSANKWRSIYSLPKFTWDSQLEKNARKTGVDGGGVRQEHQLGPGTFGQVITPGIKTPTSKSDLRGDTPFEMSYVAWLCEVSSDPQLKSGGVDQCDVVDKNLHMYYTSTGHYDILTDRKYTKIGCAFADNPDANSESTWQGLWVCDLGY